MDSVDLDLVRSVFHPDCAVVGTMEEGTLDDYLDGLEEGLLMYHATMHFRGNQYVEVDGDRGFVETWVIGHHMEAPGSPIDHLILGLRYKDEVARFGDEWKIVRREAVRQWHTGPSPVRSSAIRPTRASRTSRGRVATDPDPSERIRSERRRRGSRRRGAR